MTDIDIYGNTRELHVSETSNLQIKQKKNFANVLLFNFFFQL